MRVLVALSLVCLVLAAGCGGVSTEQASTAEPTPTGGEPTPTPGETPEPTPEPTPSGTPEPGFSRVSVFFEEVYVYDNSEPWITDPGECVFAVDVNGNYFEMGPFDCDDDTVYPLSFPTVDLDLGAGDTLYVSAAGFEDDPTGYDAMGSFDLQFGESANFGVGEHVQAGLFDATTPGKFEITFVVAAQP